MAHKQRSVSESRSKDSKPLTLVSLYHYRKAFGLTAGDIAKRSGLGLNTVYRVEQGKTGKVKSLSAYMRALGLSMNVKIEEEQP